MQTKQQAFIPLQSSSILAFYSYLRVLDYETNFNISERQQKQHKESQLFLPEWLFKDYQ